MVLITTFINMRIYFTHSIRKRLISIALLVFTALPSFAQTDAKRILDRLYANPEYKKECAVITQMRHNKVDDKKILDYLETNYAKPRKNQKASFGAPKRVNKSDLSSVLCIGDELGVELGTFGAWQGAVSSWSTNTTLCPSTPWSAATLPLAGRITIVSTPSSDPCADVLGAPILLPSPSGGKYSIHLGNNSTNSESERITRSFVVQPGDTNFIYQYAVVFEDPGHLPTEQPFFDFVMRDQNGDTIPCSYQHYSADSTAPGFFLSALSNPNCSQTSNSDTYYKPWTTVGVNLGKYVGQTITITCTSGDCSLCGHMGYAYIDFTCNGVAPISYCVGMDSILVAAPNEPGATYVWSPGGQTTSSIIVANPQIDDSVSVHVHIPTGCGYNVLYILKPTIISPGFTFTNVCNNYYFTDTSKIVNGTISSWLWNFGDGTTSNLPNKGHTYTTAGTYTVSLIVTSQLGCTDTMISIPITVAPPPVANAGPDQGICPGAQTTINASATPPGGMFIWSPSPTLSNTSISNPLANPSVTTTYYLTYTDLNGCTNFDAITVSIYSPVAPTVGPPLSICIGNSATLSVTSGTNYVWTPSSSLSSPTSANPIATPVSTTNYTVSVNDLHGCPAKSTQLVTVIQLPVVNAGADQTICNNKTAILNVNSNPAGATFSWLPSFGLTDPTISNPTFAPNTPGIYTFTVSVSTAFGCSNTGEVSVLVNPLPLVSASNAGTICPGSSVMLTATSSSAINYSWSPTSTLSNPNISNPIALPPGPGTYVYNVTVTDANSCSKSATTAVNVALQPIAAASYVPSLTCEGMSYVFKDESQAATSWNWDFGDGATSTAQYPPAHIFEFNGIYMVTLTVSNGVCQDTLTIPITIGDINTLITVQTTNVFTPNGDGENDCFQPIIGGNNATEVEVLAQCMTMEVYDRWGIKIYEVNGGSHICWDGKTISNTKAKEGTYYYLITLGGNTFKGYVTLLKEKK